MKLTEEQFNMVVNHIQRIAPGGLRCPVCGANQWSISNTVFQALEFTGTRMQIGQGLAMMPVVVLNCNNCRHCLEFNAIQLGIVERDNNNEETTKSDVNPNQ